MVTWPSLLGALPLTVAVTTLDAEASCVDLLMSRWRVWPLRTGMVSSGGPTVVDAVAVPVTPSVAEVSLPFTPLYSSVWTLSGSSFVPEPGTW